MMIFLYCYAGALLLFLFGWVGFLAWYHHKHTDERGWNKCINCGKAPSEIFYTIKWWGIVYQCSDCAFREDKP
jgi:hypothetical protein